MWDVYLSSPLRLKELNERLCNKLETHGLTVFLPVRDTDQSGGDEHIFRSNLKGIKESRTLLAVFANAGSNLSFELGFATGTGRPIFALMKDPQEVPDLMLRKCLRECSADETVVVTSLQNYLENEDQGSSTTVS